MDDDENVRDDTEPSPEVSTALRWRDISVGRPVDRSVVYPTFLDSRPMAPRDIPNIPISRPKVLLTSGRRHLFDELYRSRLDGLQESFAGFVQVADPAEKAAFEDAFGERIAWIVRSDASRDSLAEAKPFWSAVVPASIVCFIVPAILAGGPSISVFLMSCAALMLAAVIVLTSLLVAPLVNVLLARPDAGDSLATALVVETVLIAAGWWALTMRPVGFEILCGAAAGAAVALGVLYVLALLTSAYEAMLRRLKFIHDPEAEIIETLLLVAERLTSPEPPDFRYAAANLSYVAQTMDTTWRQLVPVVQTPTVQTRWRAALAGNAAGLRDLSSLAAFPDTTTADRLQQSLAVELTALVTGHYGDLLVGEPDGTDAVRPRLSRFFRGLGALVAAVMPIALLLVLPRVFAVNLDEGLFRTLLTISLSWLVLYVISWLDPKRGATPGGSVGSLLDRLPKQSGT